MGMKKRKPQPLPLSSRAGRRQADKLTAQRMREGLGRLAPDAVVYVSESEVMTEGALWDLVDNMLQNAAAAGINPDVLAGGPSGGGPEELAEYVCSVRGMRASTAREVLALLDKANL